MKILIAPDKFKGSLTAHQVCEALKSGILSIIPNAEIVSQPMADGGEGTLDIIAETLGLKEVRLKVNDPLFRQINSSYFRNENQAFIEMAKASGLPLLNASERNPLYTSTFGTGELIKHAVEGGAKEIYLMIGGSATNDAGLGMAEALGTKFFCSGTPLSKVNGSDLNRIDEVNLSGFLAIEEVKFTVFSDVQNPLFGENGAAYVYAAQKGSNTSEIQQLDDGLRSIAGLLNNELENVPGAGAAGGLGYGAMTFLNAELKSGIEAVIEIAGLDSFVQEADFVITGEGKVDRQTLEGKVVAGVCRLAKKYNKQAIVVCGVNLVEEDELKGLGAEAVYSIMELAKEPSEAISNASYYLTQIAKKVGQSIL